LKVFIPDASVILKWVIGEDEEGHNRAFEFLKGWLNYEHEFILPSLWVYEVGNVLGLKRPRDAENMIDLLLDYEFKECKITKGLLNMTFDLMKEYKGVTFYDAIYHAVAIHEDGALITSDKAYYNRVKAKGNIILI